MILLRHLKNCCLKIKFYNASSKYLIIAIEIYKAMNNLPGGNFSEFFVRNNYNYNLCSRSELTVPSINTVFKGNA